MGRDTREKIMITAIDLFNRKGSTNVSTVQLSSELHMSPGNLYYYFDNKEHLIRSIWQEMLAPKMDALFHRDGDEFTEETLMDFFLKLSTLTIDFKFFYLALPTVLHNDPQLRTLYKDRAFLLMKEMDHAMKAMSEKGMMVSHFNPIAKNLLIQNCWTLSQTGIIYVNMLGENTPAEEACNMMIQRLYALLRPYMTPSSHEKMLQLFADNNLSFQKYQ